MCVCVNTSRPRKTLSSIDFHVQHPHPGIVHDRKSLNADIKQLLKNHLHIAFWPKTILNSRAWPCGAVRQMVILILQLQRWNVNITAWFLLQKLHCTPSIAPSEVTPVQGENLQSASSHFATAWSFSSSRTLPMSDSSGKFGDDLQLRSVKSIDIHRIPQGTLRLGRGLQGHTHSQPIYNRPCAVVLPLFKH